MSQKQYMNSRFWRWTNQVSPRSYSPPHEDLDCPTIGGDSNVNCRHTLPRNPLIVGVLRHYGNLDANRTGIGNRTTPLLGEQNGTVLDFVEAEESLGIVVYLSPVQSAGIG